jgi:hypothetical protein
MLTDTKNEYPMASTMGNSKFSRQASFDMFSKANMRSTIRDKIVEEDHKLKIYQVLLKNN